MADEDSGVRKLVERFVNLYGGHGIWRCFSDPLNALMPGVHAFVNNPAAISPKDFSEFHASLSCTDPTKTHAHWNPVPFHFVLEMSGTEEYDESANGEDIGQTGPGAPTPLSALEVRFCFFARIAVNVNCEVVNLNFYV